MENIDHLFVSVLGGTNDLAVAFLISTDAPFNFLVFQKLYGNHRLSSEARKCSETILIALIRAFS